MTQQFLPASPDKIRQSFGRRKTSRDPAPSFQGGLHPVAQLQQTLGNRNVAKLIQAKRLTSDGKIIGLQPKLTIGPAEDQYKQEADRVARQVASVPDSVDMAFLQWTSQAERESDPIQAQSLQSKPLPLAGSLVPFVQQQMDGEEKIEEAKDQQENKDQLLQVKLENNPAAFAHTCMFPSDTKPLQRICPACSPDSRDEAKTGLSVPLIQAVKDSKGNGDNSARRTVAHEAFPRSNGRHTSYGLFK